MKMKTLTVNGQSFQVCDDGAVRYDEAQKLTDEQKKQARGNINAAKKTSDGILIEGDNVSAVVEVYDEEDETGYQHTTLSFLGYEDGTVKLSRVTDGEKDWDAATVGQLKAALKEKQEQLDELASHAAYKNLYGRAIVTAEDVAAAGDAGITYITIGSEDVDLSRYDDLLIRVFVPIAEGLNTDEHLLRIAATAERTYTGDPVLFLLRPQSANIAAACSILPNRNSVFAVNAMFAGDEFLYGQVMKNGYSSSYGYPGVQNAWTFIENQFVKGQKKFFHITGQRSTSSVFKFPAGTYVEVYGR